MTKVKIIHHNDLDGYVAGTILKIRYPNAKCHSVNYDNPELLPKKEDFNDGDVVFMVDYTIEDVDLVNWLKEHANLWWIDHHASSLEKQKKNGWSGIRGIRKVGLCGAELTWKVVCKGDEIPPFIAMVGDYDTFRKSGTPFHEEKVIPFSFGAMSMMERMNPGNYSGGDFLFKAFDDFKDKRLVETMIEKGRTIYEYQRVQGQIENPCNSFVRKIWGYNVLCMNSCARGSAQFTIPGTWNPRIHDIMLIYYYNGIKWAYGLYTEKKDVDVSKIALKYGGGGHQGASGFCLDCLIDELK